MFLLRKDFLRAGYRSSEAGNESSLWEPNKSEKQTLITESCSSAYGGGRVVILTYD